MCWASAIITAPDRIPYPIFLGNDLVNFWQDEAHVRGLWRRTTLDSFRAAEPHWETLLDIDALAAAEGRNWVFHGVVSLPPEYRRCLVALSDGGKDASELREFDLASRRFQLQLRHMPTGEEAGQIAGTEDQLAVKELHKPIVRCRCDSCLSGFVGSNSHRRDGKHACRQTLAQRPRHAGSHRSALTW